MNGQPRARRNSLNSEVQRNREAIARLRNISARIGEWRKQAVFIRVWSDRAAHTGRMRDEALQQAMALLASVEETRISFEARVGRLAPPLARNSRFADTATALDQIARDLSECISRMENPPSRH
jgi:hypothetical protein